MKKSEIQKIEKKPKDLVFDVADYMEEERKNAMRLLSNSILKKLKSDTSSDIENSIEKKISQIKVILVSEVKNILKNLDDLKESYQEGDNSIYEELQSFKDEYYELCDQIDEVFEKNNTTQENYGKGLVSLGERLDTLSLSVSSEFKEKLIEFGKIHKLFDDSLKSLQDGHTVSLDKFEIIDKNFLRFEEDLKKYAKNIYEYGSSFAILKEGSFIGQTGSLNFKAGSNVTLTVVANTQGGIDVTIASTAGGGTFIYNEVVAGSGTTFTLANTPLAGTVVVHGSGVRLTPGASNDYTISGAVITMNSPLTYLAGQVLADYQK